MRGSEKFCSPGSRQWILRFVVFSGIALLFSEAEEATEAPAGPISFTCNSCGKSLKARAALAGKSFGTFSFHPDCSCNLDVPIVLETLNFTPTTADPACKVDFKPGVIDVKVNLPDVFIQVGAHDSCTDHGLFGECIARTKVNVTGVTNVKNISFAFTITENQIETKTPPR